MTKKEKDVKYSANPPYAKAKQIQERLRSILYETLNKSDMEINPDDDVEDVLQRMTIRAPSKSVEYSNKITDLNFEGTIFLATNLSFEEIEELPIDALKRIYSKSVETLGGNAISFLTDWANFTAQSTESMPRRKTQ